MLRSIVFVLSLGITTQLAAEPELKTVFPFACQRGASVDVTLSGSGFDENGAVYFSQTGITASAIGKGEFRITANSDAPLGDCDLWVATAGKLVGPRRFCVTASSIVVEKEPNNTRENAFQVSAAPDVAAAVAVNGRLEKASDLDWYALNGKAGDKLRFTCRSRSLDGSVLPSLTLFGLAGRELAHSSSQALAPRIELQLPKSGTYRLLVHAAAYRSNDFSIYQLEIEPQSTQVTAPDYNDSRLQPDDLFASIKAQPEKEQSRKTPQVLKLPARIKGSLNKRNEVDWFQFAATKGQVVHLEAFGERFGQLMDLEAAIYDSKNKRVTTISEFVEPKGFPAVYPQASLDPMLDWKVPATGEYLLSLRDLYGGSVFGTHRKYQLVVAAQQPEFFVAALPFSDQPSEGVAVKRGAKTELFLVVVRSGGFTGPITVRPVEAVKGIQFEPCVLTGKEITKPIKMSIAKDAAIGFQSIRLEAEAKIGSDKKVIEVRTMSRVRDELTRRIDGLVIFISE